MQRKENERATEREGEIERGREREKQTQLSYHSAAKLVVCSSPLSVSVQIGSFHFANTTQIVVRLFRQSARFQRKENSSNKIENVNKQIKKKLKRFA